MNYFANCFTIHDAKKRFRELAQIHHPDKGGDSKIMAELIRQYDNFVPSEQPHTNTYKASGTYSRTGNAYMHEENNPFSNPSFFGRAKREGFQSSSGIPWDHPIYVELRELRSKFNYAMDEDNRILKAANQRLDEHSKYQAKEMARLREQITKYRNIIKDLKAVDKEAKPKKERVRKRKSI